MNLTYSPSTGHIKRDGAVIGIVEEEQGNFAAVLYLKDGRGANKEFFDKTLSDVLGAVQAHLEGQQKPLPSPKPARKVRRTARKDKK